MLPVALRFWSSTTPAWPTVWVLVQPNRLASQPSIRPAGEEASTVAYWPVSGQMFHALFLPHGAPG